MIGQIRCADGDVELYPGLRRVALEVTNTSARVIRVSSHYPFEHVNSRLSFDRPAAAGCHLDLPAGQLLRWGPGEAREVMLVAVEA